MTSQEFCKQYVEGISSTFTPLFAIAGFTGIVLNSCVIVCIVKTNQLRNQSIKLLFYLSMVDILSSISALLRIVDLVVGSTENCRVIAVYYTIYTLSFYMSIYLYALTGFDRYMRIKYLEEYENKFSKKRFYIVLIGYLFTCLFQAIMTGILNSSHNIGYASYYTYPISAFILIAIIVFYILSVLKLREYQRTNEHVSDQTQSMIRLTIIYLYLFIFNVGMIVLIHSISQIKSGTSVLPSIIGIMNAIAFMKVNPPSKNLISEYTVKLYIYFCAVSQVNPDIELNIV